MALLPVLAHASGCGSDLGDLTDPGQAPQPRTITLSTESLALTPGGLAHVVITVSPGNRETSLEVSGVPEGLVVTMGPKTLAPGQTQSFLKIAGGDTLSTTLTVRAVTDSEQASHAALEARLHVRVARSCPGYADPTRCPPFPTGGDLSISGVVRERTAEGTRPIADFPVWAWVQRETNGYAARSVRTNADGRYTMPLLPHAFVVLQAYSGSYDQPCGAMADVTAAGVTVDIEVVSSANPIVDPNPAPPALSGVIYETTSSGRQPVPGVRVWFETLFEVGTATTTTDENGRYTLCRLPTLPSFISPYKPGYTLEYHRVTVSGVVSLDLEIKRR